MSRTRTRSAWFTETFGSPERLLAEINEELDVEGSLLDAQTVAAALVAMTDGLHVLEPSLASPRQVESVLVHDLIPALAASFSPFAVPVLLALGDVADGRVRTTATKAAIRMLQGGHRLPVWAADLAAPVAVHDCYRVLDGSGTTIELGGAFVRAGRSWLVIATIDEECGEIDSVSPLADRPVAFLDGRFHIQQRHHERYATKESLEPAEFVRRVRVALVPLTRPELDPYVFREPQEDDDWLSDGPDGETNLVLLRSWVGKVTA